MVYISDLIADVAATNVDLAIAEFNILLQSPPSEKWSSEAILEWAHHLCTYSRYVHLNTWADAESIERVGRDFLPVFINAEDALANLCDKCLTLNYDTDLTKKIKKYANNLHARRVNLENNYCKGRNSSFDPGAMEPADLVKPPEGTE